MREIWKMVLDGRYEVSSMGRVRRAVPGPGTWVGRILKPYVYRKTGYIGVVVVFRGKMRIIKVHKLVAHAFIGPRPKGKEVNHIDTIKAHNWVENLEYLAKPEHEAHTKINGLRASGSKNGNSKLTEKEVREIRNRFRKLRLDLSKEYGVGPNMIQSIVTRKFWKNVL